MFAVGWGERAVELIGRAAARDGIALSARGRWR